MFVSYIFEHPTCATPTSRHGNQIDASAFGFKHFCLPSNGSTLGIVGEMDTFDEHRAGSGFLRTAAPPTIPQARVCAARLFAAVYSLFSAGVVAVSSISISTYKDAVTVQVAAIDKKIEVIEKANDKKIEVIEKANDRRIDAIDKKIEAIDKKIEATDKKTEAIDKKTEAIDKKTEATLVLVVVAVVAGVVVERQRAKE